MSMSELKHVSEGLRRFDVFTGGGRRRSFTATDKAAIVEESDAPHGTALQQGLKPKSISARQEFDPND